jgi:hypothetical protein
MLEYTIASLAQSCSELSRVESLPASLRRSEYNNAVFTRFPADSMTELVNKHHVSSLQGRLHGIRYDYALVESTNFH